MNKKEKNLLVETTNTYLLPSEKKLFSQFMKNLNKNLTTFRILCQNYLVIKELDPTKN